MYVCVSCKSNAMLHQFSFQVHFPTPSSPPKPQFAISLLQISNTHDELSQLHSFLVKSGLIHDKQCRCRLFLSFASLSQPRSLLHARKLLHAPTPVDNSFMYNSLIKSYSRIGDPNAAFSLFSDMLLHGFADPDLYTYTFVCNSCSKSSSLFQGKQVHARMLKCSVDLVSTESWNALMDFYLKVGEDVRRVSRILDGMKAPDVVSWNCLLDGYLKAGKIDDARKLFDDMPERDTVSWTTMLAGYVYAGSLNEARRLFEQMPERNMVSWSVMISGYVRSGQYKEALSLFREMQVLDLKTDKITLTTLLSACAGLGALHQGRWVHSFIDRHNIEVDAHLCTALVDMYCKCGRIDLAYKAFHRFRHREAFFWNAMLGGLAMHSRGMEAIELFHEMLGIGIKPNEITFICVLSACSHSGLVDIGLHIFRSMPEDHKVEPTIEHYGCLVDLLGRAGLFKEAKRVIEAMPMEADGNVWRALLGACKLHGEVELGERVGRMLLESEPLDDGNYVLLSNVYASENRWGDVARLRSMMKEKSVRKKPGWSAIELDGVAHMFVSGDRTHPSNREIYALLDELVKQFAVDPE